MYALNLCYRMAIPRIFAVSQNHSVWNQRPLYLPLNKKAEGRKVGWNFQREWVQTCIKKTSMHCLRKAGLVQHDNDGNDLVLRTVQFRRRSDKSVRLGRLLPGYV